MLTAKDIDALVPGGKADWAGGIYTPSDGRAEPSLACNAIAKAAMAKVPGLTVASGFSGHGFGTGPPAGQLAADLVTGAAPLLDPTPYRLERFA